MALSMDKSILMYRRGKKSRMLRRLWTRPGAPWQNCTVSRPNMLATLDGQLPSKFWYSKTSNCAWFRSGAHDGVVSTIWVMIPVSPTRAPVNLPPDHFHYMMIQSQSGGNKIRKVVLVGSVGIQGLEVVRF